MEQQPILITGCARSGTSLIAGAVDRCGAFGGNVLGPTPYNRRGQFEHVGIRDLIIKPYLRDRLGVDPLGQHPLPDRRELPDLPHLATKVFALLRHDGFDGGPWYFKGAKLGLIWPVWARAFPDARWLIVRREREAIVRSCLRTPFMKAFDTAEPWRQWVDHHLECFAEMRASGLAVREVWPEEALAGRFDALREAVEWTGLAWNEAAVRELVDPSLWHATAGR